MRAAWVAGALLVLAQGVAASPVAELKLQGAGPYYTFELPLAWQAEAGRGAGGTLQLQLRNGAGEPLPYAWVDALPAQKDLAEGGVPFFRLPTPKPAKKSTVDDTPRGWVLDLRGVKGDVLEIALGLPDMANGVYPVAVDASDDLQQWRVVKPAAQLVSLQREGARLDSGVIELGGVRAAYLRLRSVGSGPVPELNAAEVTTATLQWPLPALQWGDAIEPTACDAQHCDYAVPPVPLDEVELLPRAANTVARVGWLVQAEGALAPATAARHHGLRRHVHVLRDKSMPLPAAERGWQPLADGVVWWLRLPQGESKAPPQRLDGAVHPVLRVQVPGGIAQFGAQPPQLRVATRTRTLVLLVRGGGPYRVDWVDRAATATAAPAMSLAELMPARRSGDALPVDRAVLVTGTAPAAMPAPAAVPEPPAKASRAWLWVALLAGVGLMGAMAWSLLREKTAAPARDA